MIVPASGGSQVTLSRKPLKTSRLGKAAGALLYRPATSDLAVVASAVTQLV